MAATKKQPRHAAKDGRGRPRMNFSVTMVKCGGLSVADPGKLHVNRGDGVRFRNRSGGPIQLYVPELLFQGQQRRIPLILDIEDGRDSARYEVLAPPARGKRTNRYVYAVFCASTETLAVGGSDPEIIVDW